MGYQDWDESNPFFNPRPGAFFSDIYHFEALLPVSTALKETANNAKAALRVMKSYPRGANRSELPGAAVNLRTAAHWASVAGWKPTEAQKDADVLPELRIRVEALRLGDRVEYRADSTWNVVTTGSTAREAIDALLEKIMPAKP